VLVQLFMRPLCSLRSSGDMVIRGQVIDLKWYKILELGLAGCRSEL
jgi:hypothetical protein